MKITFAVIVFLPVLFAFQDYMGMCVTQIKDVRSFGSHAYDVSSAKGRYDGEIVIRRETVRDSSSDSKTSSDAYIVYYFKKYNDVLKCYKLRWNESQTYTSANCNGKDGVLQKIWLVNTSTNKWSEPMTIRITGDTAVLERATE